MAGAHEEPAATPVEKTPRQQWVEDSDLLDPGFDPEADLDPELSPLPPAARQPAAGSESPPPASPKPKHSKRVIRMALDLGLTQADIDAADPESLDEEVYVLHRQALAMAAETRRLSERQRQPEPAAPEAERDEFEELMASAQDVVHEDILKLLRSQQKKIKELEGLKGEVGSIRQRDAERETLSGAQLLDEAFDSLGVQYERVVGKGAASEVDKPAVSRRLSIIQAAGFKDMADVVRQGRGSVRSKIKAAAEDLFGSFLAPKEEEEEAPPPARKTNGRLSAGDWAKGGLARPTHRRSEGPKGEERATKAVARKQREQAGYIDDDVPQGTEESSLPD